MKYVESTILWTNLREYQVNRIADIQLNLVIKLGHLKDHTKTYKPISLHAM